MQLTSGQFDSSLFALANGGDFATDATFKLPVTKICEVQSNACTIESIEQVDAGDVKINGMERVTTDPASSGKFRVTTSETSGRYTTTVTFYTGDFADGANVEVNYAITKSNALSIDVTNDKAAVGEALLVWPVYNGGETVDAGSGTFSSNSIKGYIVMDVYRCRITQVPGFDTSLIFRLLVQ